MSKAYYIAQEAMGQLRSAIYMLLSESPAGLTNAVIGRSLGIHSGHVRHQGHISRTLLHMMELEGAVEQDPHTKYWRLRGHGIAGSEDALED